jgi:hypothetical protein
MHRRIPAANKETMKFPGKRSKSVRLKSKTAVSGILGQFWAGFGVKPLTGEVSGWCWCWAQ